MDGLERYVDEIDQVECIAILDAISSRRANVARRYTAAREHLREARLLLANAILDRQQVEYEAAAEHLDEARRQVEHAFGVAFKSLAEYGRQRRATQATMRQLCATARAGAQDSKPLLEQLAHIEAIGDVPVALGDATVTAVEGPDFELFADDPRSRAMWEGIARAEWLIVSEPDRAERQLADTTLGRAAGFGARTR